MLTISEHDFAWVHINLIIVTVDFVVRITSNCRFILSTSDFSKARSLDDVGLNVNFIYERVLGFSLCILGAVLYF